MNLHQATSLSRQLPIGQHAAIVREGQVVGQSVEGKRRTSLTSCPSGIGSPASTSPAYTTSTTGLAALRVHADQARQSDGNADLFQDLAHGRFFERPRRD